jgi:hypothetical protein
MVKPWPSGMGRARWATIVLDEPWSSDFFHGSIARDMGKNPLNLAVRFMLELLALAAM